MSLSKSKLPMGIIHFMAYPETIRGEGPVLETLQELAEDNDFSLIEITHIEDKSVRKDAVAMLKDHGKRYAFGAQPCLLIGKLNLNDSDPAARKAAS